jgi:hypothetical protein
MKDFEELEGLADQAEEAAVLDDDEDDDGAFHPANASALQSHELGTEVRSYVDCIFKTY